MSFWAWFYAFFFGLNIAFCLTDDAALAPVNVFGATFSLLAFIATLVGDRR